jgi:hypothetical protein
MSYTTREALAYSGKLPEQQGQAAITPQLLDLLAMQKVEADKKAAAQQLALANGQAPPTVAAGLQQRAMSSARQEVAQKLGLAGLAQEQPPAGPMPQGLAGAPTNLPTEYQGGGIIAFAEGGSGGDAHGRYRQRTEEETDAPVQTPQDIDQPPQMSADDIAFIRGTQEAAVKARDQNPEELGMAAIEKQQDMLKPNREAAIAHKREQQAGLKALYDRQIAERPSDLQVALRAMGKNINRPGGLGAAMVGVEESVTGARQGYTTQEIANLNSLNAIDDEIDKAIASNDVDKYNAYITRRKEVEGQIKAGLESSTTMSDVLQRAQASKETNYERIQEKKRAQLAEDARKRQLAADALEQKREAEARLEREFKFKYAELGQAKALAAGDRRAKLELDAREKAMRAVYSDPKLMYGPAEDREAAIDQMADVLLKSSVKPSGGDIASLAAQELARRQGQRRTLTGGR